MVGSSAPSGPWVHDLVELRPQTASGLSEQALQEGYPWVAETLTGTPWAVVRRVRATHSGRIAVGVRGMKRNQRWGAEIEVVDAVRLITPDEACRLSARRPQLAAFKALAALSNIGLPKPWGPGGSVGFELVTGTSSVHETSDLDVVVYADAPLDDATVAAIDAAASTATENSGTAIDVLVETPSGGVALVELVRAIGLVSAPAVMLRTPEGPQLVDDPWS